MHLRLSTTRTGISRLERHSAAQNIFYNVWTCFNEYFSVSNLHNNRLRLSAFQAAEKETEKQHDPDARAAPGRRAVTDCRGSSRKDSRAARALLRTMPERLLQ